MIIETVVTTLDRNGSVNVAPMGVVTKDQVDWKHPAGSLFQLRPFAPSQTLDNLQTTRVGVVNFVDDVLLIAQAALSHFSIEQTKFIKTHRISGLALEDATSIYEFRVQSMEQQASRWFANCEIVAAKDLRPFPGYNRAQFAVLEATIAATRIDWTPVEVFDQQIEFLTPLIEKTGSDREKEAWSWLLDWVENKKLGREND